MSSEPTPHIDGPKAGSHDTAGARRPAGPGSGQASPPRDNPPGLQNSVQIDSALLRTLIDSVPDQIFVRDRANRHVLNNHAQVTLLGASCMEETLGKTDFDFYPPEMAREFHEHNERVMSTGTALIAHEEMIRRRNGEVLWLSTTKVPLRDGSGAIVGLLGIARDITERKQAVEKIMQQAAVIDQAHDGILLLDLESRVTYVNAAA